MLEKIKAIPRHAANWVRSDSTYTAGSTLEKLSNNLGQQLHLQLKELSNFTDAFSVITARHLVIDNLTNTKAAIDRKLRLKPLVNAEDAVSLLDEQIEQVVKILQAKVVANSSEATEIACRVLNLLFCAKQVVKQKFSVVTPIIPVEDPNRNDRNNTALPSMPETELLTDGNTSGNDELAPILSRLVIPATLLYQLHFSLFPAERMMVGAGRRNGQMTSIDAVFDVTGDASAGYVRANADRLGRAMMAMSETDTYFALWIHSHPGRGKEASHPSDIDRNQEIDWLQDYSADLVNAIMVQDRYIRFWGKALENGQIAVEIAGTGIKKVAENENIYRLES